VYKKNDKKRLYWIIEKYLSGEIDAWIFCDDFYESYDLEIDSANLSLTEKTAFQELGEVAGRYSGSEEDQRTTSGFLYTEKELKRKVLETKKKLNKTLSELVKEELKKPDSNIEKSATILDETWLMCPVCIDAWESTSKNAMVICPKCNQVFHNPRFQKDG
jgi:hypothetical protein